VKKITEITKIRKREGEEERRQEKKKK